MTTLVLQLTDKEAALVARGANAVDGGISHEEFARRATHLLLRSMFGNPRGRPLGWRKATHGNDRTRHRAQHRVR